jgi:hypothetical protein
VGGVKDTVERLVAAATASRSFGGFVTISDIFAGVCSARQSGHFLLRSSQLPMQCR